MRSVLRFRSWGYGPFGRALKPLAVAAAISLTAAPVMAVPTIAMLGDSLVQGHGLAPEAGLVPQLQDWLKQHGSDAVLINAGVSGDTSAGGLSRTDWTLTDKVNGLVVALGGNDMLRGLDPATTRANLDAILTKADARQIPVLLVGIQAPGNFGPAYKAEFDKIFPDLAAKHHALYYPGFFTPLLKKGEQTMVNDYLQADGIHPNAKGVKLIVADFGPHLLDLIKEIGPGS